MEDDGGHGASAPLPTLRSCRAPPDHDHHRRGQLQRDTAVERQGVAAREVAQHADDNEDTGTAQLLELFIDETERRTWFLLEASRQESSNAA